MIYLDSAATTLQKPPEVSCAVANAIRMMASPGRGGYKPGRLAEETVYRCRESAAEIFHVPSPEQVVLTMNATHGLNIAIRSLVKPNATVLISGYEHNAVTRTLHGIPGIKIRIASGALFDAESVYRAFDHMMDETVDVVICNHVSNVFGFVQPIERIATLCRSRGKRLIIDASQSAGILNLDHSQIGADFIAMPGHKSLYGPQGTGLLLCASKPEPLLFGGTGGMSVSQQMPPDLPDRLEAGTQNVCGAAGLLEGLKFVQKQGIDQIRAHEERLSAELIQRIASIPDVCVFCGEKNQTGMFSFVAEGVDCELLAAEFGRRGVAVRAGLHCAPLAHKTAGTLGSGTVRISFSAYNNAGQLERAARLIEKSISRLRAQ